MKNVFCILPVKTMYEICVQLEINRPSWMMSLAALLSLAATEFKIGGCDYSDFACFPIVAEWRLKSNKEAFFFLEYNGKTVEITGDFFEIYCGDDVFEGEQARRFFVIG